MPAASPIRCRHAHVDRARAAETRPASHAPPAPTTMHSRSCHVAAQSSAPHRDSTPGNVGAASLREDGYAARSFEIFEKITPNRDQRRLIIQHRIMIRVVDFSETGVG